MRGFPPAALFGSQTIPDNCQEAAKAVRLGRPAAREEALMDQRIRLVTAAAVMLIGLGLALFFRRPAAETDLPIPLQSDPLVLRKQPDPRTFAATESSPAASQPHPLPAAPRSRGAYRPRSSRRPISRPRRRNCPRAIPTAASRSVRAGARRCGEMLPETASAPPTHKIIDGDSLALLAERYLGSASRAMEIYEANRNVLAHPEILPIGAELKIPRADQASDSPSRSARCRSRMAY